MKPHSLWEFFALTGVKNFVRQRLCASYFSEQRKQLEKLKVKEREQFNSFKAKVGSVLFVETNLFRFQCVL